MRTVRLRMIRLVVARVTPPHGAGAGTGVRDVQGSLPQAISDADRNLGIKLTVCLHFALPIKTIKRSFSPSH